ncbi:MAG: hypothetical protein QOE06_2804 [Thermoleophilaceae bacterium]|jgi:hypothetical protein|nr:hypothetical protein [Thermoleophilaceae bacterium]
MSLTSAEHRGLRELYASTRQLAGHWDVLAERLGGKQGATLHEGAARAERLLEELAVRMAEHDLAGFPAAQSAGGSLSSLRNRLADAALERNQALRLAVLDVQHLGTLLPYLAELARGRGDERLARWYGGWKRRLAVVEKQAKEMAVAAGRDPEAAVEPLIDSPAGRAAHGLAYAIGTVGEWVDTSAVGRGARRAARRKGAKGSS